MTLYLSVSSGFISFVKVTFGGELQEKGCRFELKVNNAEDLNRYTVVNTLGIPWEYTIIVAPPATPYGHLRSTLLVVHAA